MKIKTLFICFACFACFWFVSDLRSQESSFDDLAFEQALQSFINENLLTYGMDIIAQERFLVEQMRLINFEINSRVKNITEVRAEYFTSLESRLQELRALKSRLNTSGTSALNLFIERLESGIEQTIAEGRINYRRQKALEDGLQVLYIAEEMQNLDPGARVEGDPSISQKIQSTQQQLISNFGEQQGIIYSGTRSADANIFNLFREWKLTNTVQYELRWTDVQIVKNKLLREGTTLDKERMFKNELRAATNSYNFRMFDLAERMFGEILNRYNFISTLDDIYYYKGESNFQLDRYSLARKDFLNLAEKYPTSSFAASAYSRLIAIEHHYNNWPNVLDYFNRFERMAVSTDPAYDENRFRSAQAAIAQTDFEKAIQILNGIDSSSPFYADARYLISQAYVGAENLDEAIRVLDLLVNTTNLEPSYHFLIKMKLGYLMYEKGMYDQAIQYFDQIDGGFFLYDRVLIGYGWTYYKRELAKSDEAARDFSYAKNYLQVLIDEFYASDYVLEAKSLLGYIYQVEQKTDAAIANFDYVFRARYTKDLSEDNIKQREVLKERMLALEKERDHALSENDRMAFTSAQSRYSTLEDSLLFLTYSDLSANSYAARNEIKRMQDQIAELERLKETARARNSTSMVDRIEKVQDELRTAITSYSFDDTDPRVGVNYYDEYPMARKESVIDNQKTTLQETRNEIMAEQATLAQDLISIAAEIDRARARKNYKKLVALEIQKDKLEMLQKKYDQLATIAYDMEVEDSQVNLQKWTDYGAFGIADVNYSVKQAKLEKRSYYVDQINKINQILNSRKALLDYKITMVEGEINYMTREVRRRERLRERAELDRKFEESYFDTHTTEFEEQESTPPVIDEQPN